MTGQARATNVTNDGAARVEGAILVLMGVASLLLLANHPGGQARTFADVLKEEAANLVMNAVVHGGYIVVLAVEVICLAVLSVRSDVRRTSILAGLVLFCVGSAAMSASMLIDGLVTPAIAARFAAGPASMLDEAKSLFILCGTLVRFLMPIGLGFQLAGIGAWSLGLLHQSGAPRIIGALGVVFAGVTLAALAATAAAMNPLVLMAGLAGEALWMASIGVLMALKKL